MFCSVNFLAAQTPERAGRTGASEVLPQVGKVALLEFDLPTSPNFSPRFLHCIAIVVRVLEVETDHLSVAFELRRVLVEELPKKTSASTGTIFQMPAGSARVQ